MGPQSQRGACTIDRNPLTQKEWFATTHWSVVVQACDGSSPAAHSALDQLCRAYWLPIYAYVRRRGHRPEDAQDLTQAFFAELIGRKDFAQLDRNRGKFRSFLLACARHFLARAWRDARALKRGGGLRFVPLDTIGEEERLAVEINSETPDELVFDRQWAVAILDKAMTRLAAEQTVAGKSASFLALKAFLVEPTADGAYDAIAQQLGMSSAAVGMTVLRLRQRFRELVREAVAQTVTTPLELEEELRYLRRVLARPETFPGGM